MSHVETIEAEVKDLGCLIEAAKQIGCTLSEAETYKWFGRSVGDYPLPEGFTADELGKCQWKIAVDGAGPDTYEVGVVKRGGKYHLLIDFWQGGYGLTDAIGEKGGKLKAAYSEQVAIKQQKKQGKRLHKRRVLEDGSVQLVFRGRS